MTDRPGLDSIPQAPARPTRRWLRAWQAGWAALAVAIVAACGGGGDGGVGTNGTGVSNGTVYGFGSVIVDGIRFDDRSARVEVEQGPAGGSFVLTEAKLGQRVSVSADGQLNDTDGKASRIEVEPDLIGIVEAPGLSGGGTFTVLGQTVQIASAVAVNQQAVTVIEGAFVAGDVVEVHSTLQGSGGSLVYRATRVEKLASSTYVRLSGVAVVAGGQASSTTFSIGPVTVTSPVAVKQGDSVVIFANPSDYDPATKSLAARSVRVRSVASTARSTDFLSGAVSAINTTAKTFAIDGVTVDYSALRDADLERLTLNELGTSNDFYVRVKGRYTSPSGFVATRLQLRAGDDVSNNPAELKGVVSALTGVSPSFTGLTVRGTQITFGSGMTQSPANCVATLAAGSSYVEVKGKVIASGLEARDIKCSGSPPFDATVAQQGTVATIVDGTRFTMNLGTGGSTTVTFNANTFVRGIALNGATGAVWAAGLAIEVEGSYTDATRTVFAATKIKFNSTP